MIDYVPTLNTIPYLGFSINVLRLDLIHPEISGNKWFKLKKNIEKAKKKKFKTIVTFGGAFSNHIAATAAACKIEGLTAIGIIRGEENYLNPTLKKAKEDGMHLIFLSRKEYLQKNEPSYQNYLTQLLGPHYLIPEGGNNLEGILGCTEILKPGWDFDSIFCACGTAATFSGIVASCVNEQTVVGISVLKGENTLVADVNQQLQSPFFNKSFLIKGNEILEKNEIKEHCITNNYCFNGYAKWNKELIDFKQHFENEFKIPLDYVYTTKLFYAVFDLVKKKKVKRDAKILIIHCGGLQGNKGFEERYSKWR